MAVSRLGFPLPGVPEELSDGDREVLLPAAPVAFLRAAAAHSPECAHLCAVSVR